MDDSERGGGIFAALRSIASRFLGLVANRLHLFSLELQEQKMRLLDLLLGLLIALAVGLAGLVMATVCLAMWLWKTAGYLGLGLAAALLVGLAVMLFLRIRHQLKNSPKPFAQTIAEFQKDAECLRPKG
ncbi:MAG: phage holin family protein [Verrucomicrobiota bacterium]